eukprot:3759770-Lingulodinium_polyedra.AAC.1
MIACIACCPQAELTRRHPKATAPPPEQHEASCFPQAKPNCRYRLSASRRAGFEMLGAPLPLRPLLQPLDDTVQ